MAQTFDPSIESVVLGKPAGLIGVVIDRRSELPDLINFVDRPFISLEEVRSYFNTEFSRKGKFDVFVNETGTLNPDGSVTDGKLKVYWWKDGLGPYDLVEKPSEIIPQSISTPSNVTFNIANSDPSYITQPILDALEVRYYVELISVYTAQGSIDLMSFLADKQVDTIVLCPFAYKFANYPSDVDTTWQYPGLVYRNTALRTIWLSQVAYIQGGGDPFKDSINYIRSINKKVVCSFRLNDRHLCESEFFPTHNNFWRTHPEYWLGNSNLASENWTEKARLLNWAIPQVRQYFFDLIEEACIKYDIDGVELDFQRHRRFFFDGFDGKSILTGFIKSIRSMVDKVNLDMGKNLIVSVRVLPDLEWNYLNSFDVVSWTPYIDVLTASAQYLNNPNNIPVEEFKINMPSVKIIGEITNVKEQDDELGAGGRRWTTLEECRGQTLMFLQRGADGIQFFNFQYTLPQESRELLLNNLLTDFKNFNNLKVAPKLYSVYPTGKKSAPILIDGVGFPSYFPIENAAKFKMFIADNLDLFSSFALRIESNIDLDISAYDFDIRVNDVRLFEYYQDSVFLFPPTDSNSGDPEPNTVRFYKIPKRVLFFGQNTITGINLTSAGMFFKSFELALYV